MVFPNDFKEFIKLLNEKGVEYLVADGYAVAFHGYPRYTGDIDLWFNPNTDNIIQLSKVLKEFGFRVEPEDISDMASSEKVLQIGYPPVRIDLISFLDGVDFTSCYANKVTDMSLGFPIEYISKTDLKTNKKATGRFRDLDDLENL